MAESLQMADSCPACLVYPGINVANHLQCIQYAQLGPADPTQPNPEFWQQKAIGWRVKEGEARTRLCMNCEHYDDSEENQQCIDSNSKNIPKASSLPINPKWVDIDGMPAAVCTRYNITCSALRTCNDWEPCCDQTRF